MRDDSEVGFNEPDATNKITQMVMRAYSLGKAYQGEENFADRLCPLLRTAVEQVRAGGASAEATEQFRLKFAWVVIHAFLTAEYGSWRLDDLIAEAVGLLP